MSEGSFEIFLTVQPGLEGALVQEAREAGFEVTGQEPGGVLLLGGWPEVWRANLVLRGAGRVLARIASFRAMHLAQLDKRARKLDWGALLPRDVAFRIDASCRASRIYHEKATAQRVARAIEDQLGGTVTPKAQLRIMVRIEDDLCTISLDSSGAPLHQRGYKQAVSKAPMRETLAALFLRAAGFNGDEPVFDPMCGSGTFVIEAASISQGLPAGGLRSFAFESFANFDPDLWNDIKSMPYDGISDVMFYGSDRDQGAVQAAGTNAGRAGVAGITRFSCQPVSAAQPPDGPPGLVMVNPPYGARIGNKKALYPLYASLGQTLMERFAGWRVGIVTSEAGLARATGLTLEPPGPIVDHGGVKIRLYQTAPLT